MKSLLQKIAANTLKSVDTYKYNYQDESVAKKFDCFRSQWGLGGAHEDRLRYLTNIY